MVFSNEISLYFLTVQFSNKPIACIFQYLLLESVTNTDKYGQCAQACICNHEKLGFNFVRLINSFGNLYMV